ncbi:GNAT family N-acetyltransferase [Winogradskyella sp.]|jgi:ribosomal-protein-alanine N-acetyltransferase|uniref:GNAT family N-acetyltransferase n=1 Tax=Winogradskyella sp. TaxID=1883156 RepID=UPI0025DD1D3C|nr:GNAT family N-acetyltransferase [Winogradskyella sp.]MCT4629541.1 GNAT family N-acetyltransferase [Winogradskyella sp.]
MKIFETERLEIRRLKSVDKEHFAELFTDPKVLELIPQTPFTENQITEIFNKSLHLHLRDLNNQKCACGIYEKGNTELIGLALFLINEDDEKELGYRFRKNYWRKGYGTETTKGMLDYYFKQMKVEKVTADVNIANIGSVKILDKFMTPVREFFNESDNCTDRTYELEKNNWLEHGCK